MRIKLVTFFIAAFLFYAFENPILLSSTYDYKDGKSILIKNAESKLAKVYKRNLLSDNLSSTIDYSWEGGNWLEKTKSIFTYDSYNRVTEEFVQYSVGNNTWANRSRTLYAYASGKQPVEIIDQEYNSGTWKNASKSVYTFDSEFLNTEVLSLNWTNGEWVNYVKVVYTYSKGKVIEKLVLEWNDNAWKNNTRTKYTIDSDGFASEYQIETWDDNQWKVFYRTVVSYDSKKNVTQELGYNWNETTWNLSSKYSYSFDANNRLLEQIISSRIDPDWLDMYKTNYSYDNNGNEVLILYYNGFTGKWRVSSRTTAAFDSNNRITEEIFENCSDNDVWENSRKTLYFYGDSQNSISENIVAPSSYKLLQNYPNPFNPSTIIKFNLPEKSSVKLSVYNMMGQEITSLINTTLPAGIHEINFNASGLSSGVYFYKFVTPKMTLTKRMILAK